MYSNGYVGTGEDVQRIRRMEKQREEQRKKFEAMHKQTKDQADAAGLKQFGASTEEVSCSVVPRQWVARRAQPSKGVCTDAWEGGTGVWGQAWPQPLGQKGHVWCPVHLSQASIVHLCPHEIDCALIILQHGTRGTSIDPTL